jgi:hypothetical protein
VLMPRRVWQFETGSFCTSRDSDSRRVLHPCRGGGRIRRSTRKGDCEQCSAQGSFHSERVTAQEANPVTGPMESILVSNPVLSGYWTKNVYFEK